MTNLTNAEKYTPQFGFERGVVVEIIRNSGSIEVGMFEKVYGGEIEIIYKREYSGQTASLWFNPENIKSLRLLSWPFAIWQFAPSNTTHVLLYEDADIGQNRTIVFVRPPYLPSDYEDKWRVATLEKPWWHQPKETKNANGK